MIHKHVCLHVLFTHPLGSKHHTNEQNTSAKFHLEEQQLPARLASLPSPPTHTQIALPPSLSPSFPLSLTHTTHTSSSFCLTACSSISLSTSRLSNFARACWRTMAVCGRNSECKGQRWQTAGNTEGTQTKPSATCLTYVKRWVIISTRIRNIKNVTRCRDSRSAKSIETR